MRYAPILVGGLALSAQAQVDLGSAAPFSVLAATTITNTGLTVVAGQLGIFPNGLTSITGFPPGISGEQHGADAAAQQAQADATTAYNQAAGLTSTQALTGQDLGGMTLSPGVYSFTSSAQLTGTLTLDAQGDPNAQFVFQIGSTLTTASASSVRLINGANACNVFFQVGSSATLGTGTMFAGNILALTSITVTTGTSVNGGLYALNAAVTLDTNAVTQCQGSVVVTPTSTLATTTTATTPTTTATTPITTSPATSTITSTITVIVTQPASTVTIPGTGTVTVTKTTSTQYTTRTSTTTSTSTKSVTKTRPTPSCTAKNAKRAAKKTKTVYNTVTSTKKGGKPTTVTKGGNVTKTTNTDCTKTSTKWQTTYTTTSSTRTVTPPCTTQRAVRRFERY